MALGLEKEFVFKDELIKYTYKKAVYSKENKLVIVFSAFSTNGAPPQYSYMRTLEGIDVNQLFILDGGARGFYYLGQAPDFNYEKGTIALIEKILKDNNIEKKDCICIGSSKGGWAALYFGIKLGLGYVIAGEPQVFIAKYLLYKNGKDVLDFITNENNCYHQIDNLLMEQIKGKDINYMPHILVHAGSESYHYKEHIKAFIKEYPSEKLKLDIEEYSEHNELIKYFPNLLVSNILKICTDASSNLYIEQVDIKQKGNKFICKVKGNEVYMSAWYVYRDTELIFTRMYEKNNCLEYFASTAGKYRFRAFASDIKGNKISEGTSVYVVNRGENVNE